MSSNSTANVRASAAALARGSLNFWSAPLKYPGPRKAVRGEFESLVRITGCVLHAMVRPRKALRAALRPLLLEIGDAAVVTLQAAPQ